MRKKFTLLLVSLLACVGVMAQKAHQRVSHEGWVVTALNEAVVYGNEGGVAFIADDNAATFYHSNWSSNYDDGNGVNKGKDGLQAFMVELPHSLSDLSLITYKGRSDNNSSGWARGVRVYVYETLPVGWPAGGLSSLGYADKEALLASTNANLGTAAFDNTAEAKLWTNDRTPKLVEFATPQSGKYVLFIMERGSDAWLTCSDFQIYQYKDYAGVVDGPYVLQVLNAKAEGDKYIDTFTGIGETSGNTISIGDNMVKTYFKWDVDAWIMSTNENVDGNYVKVSYWCANTQATESSKWELFVNDDQSLSILQRAYDGGGDNSRCFIGGSVISNAAEVKLFTDNAKDKAINVKFVEASKPIVAVKYIFTYNNETKYEQVQTSLVGGEYPDVSITPPFGLSATKPEGKIEENEVVEGVVTKTIELQNVSSFVPAADVNSITNWYHLIFHATQKNYLYYTADGEVLVANKTVVDADDKDAYTWAFIGGDPFDGFKLYNKKAGKYLDAIEGGAAVVAEGEQVFLLTPSTSTSVANGFFMQAKDGDYTQRFNKQSEKVVYWSNADDGSTFMVELCEDSESLLELVASAKSLLTALGDGTAVGCITEKSRTAVSDAIAAANAAIENGKDYLVAEAGLQAALDALETIQPDPTKSYTIVSASSDNRGGQMMYINNEECLQFRPDYDNSAVFQFVEAGEGKFYLYNVVSKTYLSTAKAHNGGQAEVKAKVVEDAKPVVITNMGRSNVVKIVPVGGAMLHAQADYSMVVAWDKEDNTDASAWMIEETPSIPTNIEASVLNAQPSNVIYDLQGRRVMNPVKGIYIVGGKKVVIK